MKGKLVYEVKHESTSEGGAIDTGIGKHVGSQVDRQVGRYTGGPAGR